MGGGQAVGPGMITQTITIHCRGRGSVLGGGGGELLTEQKMKKERYADNKPFSCIVL